MPRRNSILSVFEDWRVPRWRPHPWLVPFNLAYLAVSRLHGVLLARSGRRRRKSFSADIPLIVIGALKSGGSGKTSVTLALARALGAEGLSVAVLAYAVRGNLRGAVMREVVDADDWRTAGDEACMLRRMGKARVFLTRDRETAWRKLHEPEIFGTRPFDVVLSDDGYQDRRLRGASFLLLTGPGERPGWRDVLPAGLFRETWVARKRADWIWEGPFPFESNPIEDLPVSVTRPVNATHAANTTIPLPFHRRWILPEGFSPSSPWIALCGLGDNAPFLRDLSRAGVRPVAVGRGKNHAAWSLKALEKLSRRHPEARFLCTRKDAMRLPETIAGRELSVIDQEIILNAAWVGERVADIRVARSGNGSLRGLFGILPR